MKEIRDYYTWLDRLEAKRSGLDGSLSRLYWRKRRKISMFPIGDDKTSRRTVPALIVIGGWIVLQFFSCHASIVDTADTGEVAYQAHIGGFIAGFGLIFLFRGSPRACFAGVHGRK